MSYTRYLNKLTDSRIIKLICLSANINHEEITHYKIHRQDNCLQVTLYENVIFDGETEETNISDYFEIDDFSVTPYDYAGDKKESFRWRLWMYQLFGHQYALDYLLST